MNLEAESKAPLKANHVALVRDEYYTNPGYGKNRADPPSNYLGPRAEVAKNSDMNFWPWGTMNKPKKLVKHPENPELDEFFVMGDNSPNSSDSRFWWEASPTLQSDYHLGTVPRYNMLGKAFFVYWPAGFRLPGVPQVPLIPNVGDMRFIR